jgi:hypothetical protein
MSTILSPYVIADSSSGVNPHNGANSLYYILTDPTIGLIAQRSNTLQAINSTLQQTVTTGPNQL